MSFRDSPFSDIKVPFQLVAGIAVVVCLVIAIGVIVAGVAGALVAVPLAATLNAVVQHLAEHTDVGEEDPDGELEEDLEEMGEPDPRQHPDLQEEPT